MLLEIIILILLNIKIGGLAQMLLGVQFALVQSQRIPPSLTLNHISEKAGPDASRLFG